MSGYFASLIQHTGLAVDSRQAPQAHVDFGGHGTAPQAEPAGIVEETVELAAPRPESTFDPQVPHPKVFPVNEPEVKSIVGETAVPDPSEFSSNAAAISTGNRLELQPEPVHLEQTAIEMRAETKAANVDGMALETGASHSAGESRLVPDIHDAGAPPGVEQHDARLVTDSDPEESASIGSRIAELKVSPESEIERVQAWHETYQTVRNWVAAAPSIQEMAESFELQELVDLSPARRTIVAEGWAPALIESARHDSKSMPEIHLSIGTISVVVEETAPPPDRSEPPARSQNGSEPAADWTRLRRLYIR